jgi:uncharacterized protein
MLLRIQDLESRHLQFDELYAPGQLDFGDSGITALSPLHAVGEAELLPGDQGQVRLQGKVSGEVVAECDRCLTPANFAVDAAFDLFYEPATTAVAGDEIAIQEADTEIGFYEGEGIELEQVLVEQILLQLPMQRVCREDCQGICQVCGSDRNVVNCDCYAKPADDRWAGLSKLTAEKLS